MRTWSEILAAVTGRRSMALREVSWWLAPELSSVRDARRLTRRQLGAWGLDDQVEVAELLVSEVVGNALGHGSGQVRLGLAIEDGLLRCEVEDENPELPRLRSAEVDDESGRGLFLVDTLSCCWGGERTARGKAVWFELPAPTDDGTAGAPAPVAGLIPAFS
jgi:hypothetical protein